MSSAIKAGRLAATVAAFTLLLTGAAYAQSRGAHGRMNSGGTTATPFHPNFAPLPQVPGLGFDYVHLAAVGGKVSNSSGDGHNQFVTPIFGGIVPFYSAIVSDPSYTAPQPSVIVVQQPPQTIVVQMPAPQEPVAAQSAPPANIIAADPLPELGEFVFVRRDGQTVLAIAFTAFRDRLTYITRDGTRRSFPIAELDKDATLQINDANGTTLTLPN